MNRFSARARLGMVLIGLAVGLTALRPAAAQQNRIALLIGNAAYADAPLKNPAKDARDMADVLQQLGFEVMLTTDADRRQIIDAIRAFGQRMTGSSVALFYYSGHGLQYRGQNYLMPLNAQIQSETDIEFEMVDVDRLLAEMDAANRRGVNLVIFDACRVNPVKSFLKGLPDGLAQIAAPTGSLIAYASAPGTPSRDDLNGDNSVYTRRLLEALRAMPSEDIYKLLVWVRRQVMADTGERQVPWEASSLTGEFAFAAGSSTAPHEASSCWENATPGAICKEETTGMEFVYVPGGCFNMGSTASESEQPVHEVCLDGFWMGKYEVTQAQWQAVMGNNPSRFTGADRPVEPISWNDAQAFVQKLNAAVETHGRVSLQFHLPSEAQWEYAARAGTQTAYSFGDSDAALGEYAWYDGNSGGETHPVGQKKPNDFGLYDMHGNMWEWVADTYHDTYQNAPKDGSFWGDLEDGNEKVMRGGSWYGNQDSCRSANRHGLHPVLAGTSFGCRVVAVVARPQ